MRMRNLFLSLAFVLVCLPASAQPRAQSAPRPVAIVYLEHLDARATVDIVSRLLGPDGMCAPHAETNSLILVDDPAHVTRIREVVQQLEERAAQRRPQPRPARR